MTLSDSPVMSPNAFIQAKDYVSYSTLIWVDVGFILLYLVLMLLTHTINVYFDDISYWLTSGFRKTKVQPFMSEGKNSGKLGSMSKASSIFSPAASKGPKQALSKNTTESRIKQTCALSTSSTGNINAATSKPLGPVKGGISSASAAAAGQGKRLSGGYKTRNSATTRTASKPITPKTRKNSAKK